MVRSSVYHESINATAEYILLIESQSIDVRKMKSRLLMNRIKSSISVTGCVLLYYILIAFIISQWNSECF